MRVSKAGRTLQQHHSRQRMPTGSPSTHDGGSGAKGRSGSQGSVGKGRGKKGRGPHWKCEACQFSSNFAERDNCFKCHESKPPSKAAAAGKPPRKGRDASMGGAKRTSAGVVKPGAAAEASGGDGVEVHAEESLQAQLDAARAALSSMIGAFKSDSAPELSGIRKKVTTLEAQIAQSKPTLDLVAEQEKELKLLSDKLLANDKELVALREKISNAEQRRDLLLAKRDALSKSLAAARAKYVQETSRTAQRVASPINKTREFLIRVRQAHTSQQPMDALGILEQLEKHVDSIEQRFVAILRRLRRLWQRNQRRSRRWLPQPWIPAARRILRLGSPMGSRRQVWRTISKPHGPWPGRAGHGASPRNCPPPVL